MSLTIHKTSIDPDDGLIQDIEVPEGSEILSAREQGNDKLSIWYRCHPNLPAEKRRIALIETGAPAPSSMESKFLGTGVLFKGTYVVHIFEQA